jgi:hypothetical protein
MPAIIVPAGSVNLAALGAPKAVVAIQQPSRPIVGGQTNILGIVGVGSWGPVGVATVAGGNDDTRAFSGPPTVRKYDLATAVAVGVEQNCSAYKLVRVSDGTDTAAFGLYGASENYETATIGGTVTVGDVLHITATPTSGTAVTIGYMTKAGDTTTTMAAGLLAAFQASALPSLGLGATAAAGILNIYYAAGAWSFTQSVSGAATETILLSTGSATVTKLTGTALYTGVVGNGLSYVLAAGTKAGSLRVTIRRPGYVPEVFDNITGAGNQLWVNAAAAVNNGNSVQRGPSQLMIMSAGPSAAPAPASPVTVGLAGGTDGATSVTDATLLGIDTAPRTGLYALRNQGCGVVNMVDTSVSTYWTNYDAFALPEATLVYTSTPPSDTVTTAPGELAAAGIDDWPIAVCFGDWIYWWDEFNQTQRLLAPATFAAALRANLSPEQSVLNKPLRGVIGSQKTLSGGTWAQADIDAIYGARLELIMNPVPGGYYWGCAGGVNASSNAAINGDNYSMMTNFLARSVANWAGSNVGQLQTPDQRTQAKAVADDFFNGLWKLGMIGNADSALGIGAPPWSVLINDTTTPANLAALGYEIAAVNVQYLSVIRWMVVQLQGGQTVSVTVSNAAPSFAQQAA